MSEGQTSAAAFPSPGAPGGAVGWPGPPSARPQLPRAAPFPVTGPTGRQPHRYQPFRVQPRHRGRKPPTVNPHRGRLIPIGAGNHPLGQANNLPQCTVTYPNATTHLLQQCRATEKLPHCLPQCGPAHPNAGPPASAGPDAPAPCLGRERSRPPYHARVPRSLRRAFLRTALTISRSRADQAPLAKRTSTEATRCCAVRSSRPVSGSEATTHSPVAEGGSAAPASTSGPTCGQAGPFAGKNHA